MHPRPALVTVALLAGLVPLAPSRAQITSVRVASGLNNPVYLTTPPDDASRLFVLERPGLIRIIDDGSLLPTPFLDITAIVLDAFNEQGLLGLAFDPDYANNGQFFVYFTEGSGAGRSTIFRYNVSANPDLADPNSSFRVITVVQPFVNHNGGQIAFGTDGYLYLGLGDGGSAGDPADRAQNGAVLLGKMLRLDVSGADAFPADSLNNYAIPPTNPFVTDPQVRDEIWALGLRNPYRWSFDRQTDDLWIADVGQNCWEEINFTPASSTGGENYGWDVMEGLHCFNEANHFDCVQGPCGTGLVDPVVEYGHGPECSVTGGYVYRGSQIPAIQGLYFFADYCSDQVHSVAFEGATMVDSTNWTAALDPPNAAINSVSGFGEDADGELYIVDLGGEVFKIIRHPASDALETGRPGKFGLGPARPNPFTRSTRLDLQLDRDGDVAVGVYDVTGRLVRRLHAGFARSGMLPLSWTVEPLRRGGIPAGIYFVRAESAGRSETKSVVLVR
jgi:glucose/arabinose dehydrogenase